MRHCRSCKLDISSRPMNHFLCVQCYADAARRLKAGGENAVLSIDKVDQLVELSQPKLHNNSPVSQSIHSWLKTVRETLLRAK